MKTNHKKGDDIMEFSNEKVNEALGLLEEALKDKKDELYELINEKYTGIKDVFNEKLEAGKEMAGQIKEDTMDAVKAGEEKIVKKAHQIDKDIHKNPWSYIGGAAVVSLLLGFILGGKK